ncbi:DUF84 family protein [Metabacillus iocasae]|uniref:inosine/xanthosine triphosphatase n=1 Tax=Priestia iocasae TaxID=2291674 RepID=A0ABS2QZG8_9BACI|nr:DUF84 family protein [Metabacillus iocasae]MBM7704878.1 inosine/xanthosine triphosphatase [Metabacillus iocasae]
MRIGIGTTNPTKVNAVEQAIRTEGASFWPVKVDSGVSAQPFSDDETIKGAINRAEAARQAGNAHIGIGLEGGVVETHDGLFLCNWGALVSSSIKKPIIAGGARILLPAEIAEALQKEGVELAQVMDSYTKKMNVRQKEGAIGIFTNGQVNRTKMFTHIVEMLYGQYQFQSKQNES